jgi:CheY-like chemotaxis protein
MTSSDASRRLAGIRVLVVDDEAEVLTLTRAILEDEGAIVSGSASASDALDTLQRERPGALISDLSMPGNDGYWLIGKIRARSPARGGMTPAAAVTGNVSVEDRARVLRAGFQFHVPKPVDWERLIGVVAVLALKE